MPRLKRTPIFPVYQDEVKCTEFAGFELPLQFSRIQEEHEAVRKRAGLFDISHMGLIDVIGPDALTLLQQVTTNDVARLSVDQVQYTTMCHADGGTIDDLLIYRWEENYFRLVVNAANRTKDEAWLQQHAQGKVKIINESDKFAILALQGPLSEKILQQLVELDLSRLSAFTFQRDVPLCNVPVILSRTGYTGEDGFELFIPREAAPQIWQHLLVAGRDHGLLPCGLGARDTLRFEAAFPLYGQELSDSISPVEAGIGFVVNAKKGSFIGQDVLLKQKKDGAPRKLVGFEMMDRGIPRSGYLVWADGVCVGFVTTGTRSPTLQKDIALALIKSEYDEQEKEWAIEIRGRSRKAKRVPLPFYRRR